MAKRKDKTATDIQSELDKMALKKSKLLADLAVKKHPELAESITTVSAFIREAEKANKALSLGADTNVAAEKERLDKQIAYYQNKIDALKTSAENIDPAKVKGALAKQHGQAMVNLKKAVAAVNESFADKGVEIGVVLPQLAAMQEAIDATEIPAEAPDTE